MRSTNLNHVQKTSYFKNIFSWVRKKNNNSTLKYLKLTMKQKKEWTFILVQSLHYRLVISQDAPFDLILRYVARIFFIVGIGPIHDKKL